MSRRKLTVDRYKEIERLLAAGRGVREITRSLRCSRRLVRQIRDGVHAPPDQPRSAAEPLWMTQVDWAQIIHDLGLGHPLKFLWEEKAQALTTYSNFWKQFYRKYPQYRQAAVTAREFQPGERVEVDYAGDTLEWVELSTGEIRKAYVFVAGLGFSQLLFAWAAEDTKSLNWLACHRRMFAFYGGVAHVTVPDCLKQGVLKCHLYDPDLNPGYAEYVFSVYMFAALRGGPAFPGNYSSERNISLRSCSQRPQELHDARIPAPLPCGTALSDITSRQSGSLHFEIDLRVNVRCVQRSMAKPGADRVDINTGAKQVNRARVPSHVRTDMFCLQRWQSMSCPTRCSLYKAVDTEPRQRMTEPIEKDWFVRRPPPHERPNSRHRVRPEWTVPSLIPLTDQTHNRAALQIEIANREPSDFIRSRAGVV